MVVLPLKPPWPGVLERPLADQEGGAPRITVWMESARTPPRTARASEGCCALGRLAATLRGRGHREGRGAACSGALTTHAWSWCTPRCSERLSGREARAAGGAGGPETCFSLCFRSLSFTGTFASAKYKLVRVLFTTVFALSRQPGSCFRRTPGASRKSPNERFLVTPLLWFLWPLWHVALMSAPLFLAPASLSGHTWLSRPHLALSHLPDSSPLSSQPPSSHPRAPGRPAPQRAWPPPPPALLSRDHSD